MLVVEEAAVHIGMLESKKIELKQYQVKVQGNVVTLVVKWMTSHCLLSHLCVGQPWVPSNKKYDDACLDVIGNLGKKDNIDDRKFIDIGWFICQLYKQGTCIKTMKELSLYLFSKRQWTDEKLPPTCTTDALSQVIKRANYVALSWKNCGQPFQTVQYPEQHGWI